jgi:hypothetical protein
MDEQESQTTNNCLLGPAESLGRQAQAQTLRDRQVKPQDEEIMLVAG